MEAALTRTSETREIEFKREFDPTLTADWCELLKDVFAIINSGGGIILFGLDNCGIAVGASQEVQELDPAIVADKIYSYTNQHFGDIEIFCRPKAGKPIVGLRLGPTEVPLVPSRAGTYERRPGKPRNAFTEGAVYVRHGAKSEPATSEDLRQFLETRLTAARNQLLEGVTKVFEAPKGAHINIAYGGSADSTDLAAVRLARDPNAQTVSVLDPNTSHPYRMKEILSAVNTQIGQETKPLNAYDIKVALAVFGLEKELSFVYRPDHGPTKYSEAFVEWLLSRLAENRHAFRAARSQYRRLRRADNA